MPAISRSGPTTRHSRNIPSNGRSRGVQKARRAGEAMLRAAFPCLYTSVSHLYTLRAPTCSGKAAVRGQWPKYGTGECEEISACSTVAAGTLLRRMRLRGCGQIIIFKRLGAEEMSLLIESTCKAGAGEWLEGFLAQGNRK